MMDEPFTPFQLSRVRELLPYQAANPAAPLAVLSLVNKEDKPPLSEPKEMSNETFPSAVCRDSFESRFMVTSVVWAKVEGNQEVTPTNATKSNDGSNYSCGAKVSVTYSIFFYVSNTSARRQT